MRALASFLLFFSFGAFGEGDEPVLKTIELEWEAVENAFGYEVRLTPEGGQPLFFRTLESRISEQVPVGVYALRIRSRHREHDLWSPWSEPLRLEVLVKELELLRPEHDALLTAKSAAREVIEFAWSPVAKAKGYTLTIWTEETKAKPIVFKTTKTTQRLKLIPGQVYFWQVTFESANGVSYVQVIKTNMFALQGQKLIKPSIHPFKPGAPRVTLSWIASPKAKVYRATLFHRHLDETKWVRVKDAAPTVTHWEVGPLKAGQYRVEMTAEAPRHAASDMAHYEFDVKPSREELETKLSSLTVE